MGTNGFRDFFSENKAVKIPIALLFLVILFFAIHFAFMSIIITYWAKVPGFTLQVYIKSWYTPFPLTERFKSITALAVVIIYLYFGYLAIFKKRKREDKVGTAKIASAKDRENLRGLVGKDGITLSQDVRLAAKTSYEHILIVGPTGCGKTSSFIIPNLLSLPGKSSLVISDPKGELYQLTSERMKELGRKPIIFAPLNPDFSIRYNPLDVAADLTQVREMAQSTLMNGAMAIELATGKKGGGDSEWINMSTPLWCASLLFCKALEPPFNTIESALSLLISKTAKEIDFLFSNADDDVQAQYNLYKQAGGSEKTASSIKTVLSSNLQLFTDHSIAKVSSASEFDPYILRDEPTAIYVMCPERKSSYVSPFMSVFYTQILDKILDKSGIPVYLILDEFANIGVIPNISQIAATCRSREVSLVIAIQGVEQLYRNYGQENAQDLMNNLKTKMFYPALAYNSAEYASKLCGYGEIEVKSTSSSGERGDKNSYSFSKQRKELLDPDEVRRLDQDSVLQIIHNRLPVISKQMKYYKDKKLMKHIKKVEPQKRDDLDV